jgi:hypothetical protein
VIGQSKESNFPQRVTYGFDELVFPLCIAVQIVMKIDDRDRVLRTHGTLLIEV